LSSWVVESSSIPFTIILNSRILLEFEQGEVCKREREREEEERVEGKERQGRR
jgi:hypothetical protein